MGNTFKSTTLVWEVDETGTLNTAGVEVQHIIWNPNNNGDQIKLSDNADNVWLHLWGKYGGLSYFFPFVPSIKMPSLKVTTISGGAKAYIQFRTDMKK